jgi:O-antigen ligase
LQKFGIISTLFYQVGDSSFSQYLQEGRSFGPFESPNFLAMFLVPMTFLSSPILEFIKTRWIRIVAVISFALPILALYFSNSRAGYITFVLCLLLFINYRFINLQKTKNRKPFFAAWFVLLFVVFNAGYLFFSTHNFKPDNNSDVIRVEIYKYSNTLLQQHPILGIGLGQFQSSIRELSKDNIAFQTFSLPYALHPHNLFLALWLNLGLAGLIVFILILVKLFQGLYFNDSKYKAYFIAAAFAILIHGLFDTTYFKNDLSAIFWLIFALSLIARSEE